MELYKHRELDVWQLIKIVCLRWRLVLSCVLIGVFVFSLLGTLISIKEMTDAREAYNALIAGGNTTEAENVVIPSIVWFDKAFVLIGLLLGVFIPCVCVGVPYILSPSIRCKEEVKESLGIPLLGVVQETVKTKGGNKIDRWLRSHLFSTQENTREDVLGIAATDILLTARKKGIESIYFTSCSTAEQVKLVIKDIRKELDKQALPSQHDVQVMKSSDSIRRMLEAGGVVLVEKINDSRYDNVTDVLKYCDRFDVPVLGYILIEESNI